MIYRSPVLGFLCIINAHRQIILYNIVKKYRLDVDLSIWPTGDSGLPYGALKWVYGLIIGTFNANHGVCLRFFCNFTQNFAMLAELGLKPQTGV